MKYNEVALASTFTLFVNNGGLRGSIPIRVQRGGICRETGKANVCQQGQKITTESKLKQKMIVAVCSHFVMDCNCPVFDDHEQGLNENVFEDDHKSTLIKFTADRFFMLRLFTYGKRYNDTVVTNG